MVESQSMRRRNIFKADECTRCGKCLTDCPEMQLPLDIAKSEIIKLIHGKETDYVLQHCTSCFS